MENVKKKEQMDSLELEKEQAEAYQTIPLSIPKIKIPKIYIPIIKVKIPKIYRIGIKNKKMAGLEKY